MRIPKPVSKRTQDKLDGFQIGMRLWDTAPDDRRLEKRFTINFTQTLCHLDHTWRQDEYGRDYAHTPVGDLRTFGDLRALMRRAYAEIDGDDASTAAGR